MKFEIFDERLIFMTLRDKRNEISYYIERIQWETMKCGRDCDYRFEENVQKSGHTKLQDSGLVTRDENIHKFGFTR